MKVLSETKQVRIRLRSNGTNRWKLVVILRDNKDRLHEAHIARRVLEAIHPCHFITELAKAYHPADKWIISQLKHPNNTDKAAIIFVSQGHSKERTNQLAILLNGPIIYGKS